MRGVPEALRRSPAKLIYVLNLMTKRGETAGYTASQHVKQIIHYGGRVPDAVVVQRGAPLPAEMARRYQAEAAAPVEVDAANLETLGVALIRPANVMSRASKARHDPGRTATALRELFAVLAPAPV